MNPIERQFHSRHDSRETHSPRSTPKRLERESQVHYQFAACWGVVAALNIAALAVNLMTHNLVVSIMLTAIPWAFIAVVGVMAWRHRRRCSLRER